MIQCALPWIIENQEDAFDRPVKQTIHSRMTLRIDFIQIGFHLKQTLYEIVH